MTQLRAGKRWGAALVPLALLAASCGDDGDGAPGAAGSLQIATTVAPLTNIVANVAGDLAEVTGLIPGGVDSHTFDAPPSVAESLTEADVFFYNGLDLEDSIEQVAFSVMDDDDIVALGEEVLAPDEYIFDFSFPEEGGSPNPHLWTNPPMAKAYAEVIRDVLSELDPDNAEGFAENYDLFATQVDALDAAMVEATATVPEEQRKLLTYHDGYPYMADHYGWEIIGAIQPAHFGEPTAAEVADLATQIEEEGVMAIFGSEVFPSPVLEQLANETGVEYYDELADDELPGEPGDDEHTWVALMQLNFIIMVEALGGDASALDAVESAGQVPDTAIYP